MALKRFIFAVLLTAVLTAASYATWGGAWHIKRRVIYGPTIGLMSGLYPGTQYARGATTLSLNYHTRVAVDSITDSLYTVGLDSLGYYYQSLNDSFWYHTNDTDSVHIPYGLGTDTTCLYLDWYVGQYAVIAMFFGRASNGGALPAETCQVYIEQSLRYDKELRDSAAFYYGFIEVDTLFTDKMVTVGTYKILPVPAVSGAVQYRQRTFVDTVLIRFPAFRMRIVVPDTFLGAPMDTAYIEFYLKHPDNQVGIETITKEVPVKGTKILDRILGQ